MAAIDDRGMEDQPVRRKIGFLNSCRCMPLSQHPIIPVSLRLVMTMTITDSLSPLSVTVEDLIVHLGYRLTPFLPVLISITCKLLAEGTRGIREALAGVGSADDRSRELRTSSLKILSQVWARFPTEIDYKPFLGHLLSAIQPIIGRLPAESYSEK